MKFPAALLLPLLLPIAHLKAVENDLPRNHQVRELVSAVVEAELREKPQTVEFEMQHEGWVYLQVIPAAESKGGFSVQWGGGELAPLARDIYPHEGMRFFPAGSHAINIIPEEGAAFSGVVVRKVPEIFYFSADYLSPAVQQIPHAIVRNFEMLKKQGVIQNYNVIASERLADFVGYAGEAKRWRSSGRKWVSLSKVPRRNDSVDEVELLWATPMSHSGLDGVIVDEFGQGERFREQFGFWGESLRQISKRKAIEGKQFYAFTGFSRPDVYAPLAKALLEANYRIAPEIYFRSMKLLEGAPERMRQWREIIPGIEQKMVLFLGPDNIAPAMTFHLQPEMNYKMFLEEQFRTVALDEAFEGLAGMGLWVGRYMDDDVLNWHSRLVRHYLIEGQVSRLGSDPLITEHLVNPGFEEREVGWTLEPAEAESIGFRTTESLPYVKRPYSAFPEKKLLLKTVRSPNRPNRVRQTIRNLTPGRVYHLNVYALDPTTIDREALLPLTVKISGVEMLRTRNHAMRTSARRAQAAAVEGEELYFPTDAGGNVIYVHHYHRLFRAKAENAELELADWGEADMQALAPANEVVWDFIELAPDVSLELPGERGEQ